VHKGTTKIERHHKFAKHLAFGVERSKIVNPGKQKSQSVGGVLRTWGFSGCGKLQSLQKLLHLEINLLRVRLFLGFPFL
jgi:hypothetical protein